MGGIRVNQFLSQLSIHQITIFLFFLTPTQNLSEQSGKLKLALNSLFCEWETWVKLKYFWQNSVFETNNGYVFVLNWRRTRVAYSFALHCARKNHLVVAEARKELSSLISSANVLSKFDKHMNDNNPMIITILWRFIFTLC